MKKCLALTLFALTALLFVGCGKVGVENFMSECTTIYFAGSNEDGHASISVGERENPYIKDGVHEKTCEYSLICLDIGGYYNMRLSVQVNINGRDNKVELELVNGTYMCDLEYKLKADDKITIKYNDKEIELKNVSSEFAIDYVKAIEIGSETLKAELAAQKDGFECYLRVLGDMNGENELFWCFTVLGRDGESKNCIIDVKDGSIIAKD